MVKIIPKQTNSKEEFDAWLLTEEGKRWKKQVNRDALKELYRKCFPFFSSMPIGLGILAILAIVLNVMFLLIGI